MRSVASVLAFISLIALASAVAPLLNANAPRAIDGQYLVVFQKSSTPQIRDAHVKMMLENAAAKGLNDSLIVTFTIGQLIGYSATLSESTLQWALQDKNVQYVEVDQVVSLADDSTTTQEGATWGIDRIDQYTLPLDSTYTYYSSAGEGVDAYIIDTGIYTAHDEFATGRAVWGTNTIDTTNSDCHGHGTHVAGTVGGTIYGVAKLVNLIAVKVLDCNGGGTITSVVAGIQWATNQFVASKKNGIGNMSLGGGASTTLDNAVAAATAQGLSMSVAAGNSNADACYTSPARAASALTVGATTSQDSRAYFSNYGPCLDIFAPGEYITSAWIGSPTALRTISGTSMAAPHVAGAVAVFLAQNYPDSVVTDTSVVSAWLVQTATANVVVNPGARSPNLMLYSPYSSSGSDSSQSN